MIKKNNQNFLAEAPFLLAFLYALGTVFPILPYFNIGLGGAGILTISISFFTEKMSPKKWCLLAACSAGTLISLAFTVGPLYHQNEIAYFLIFGLYVLYFSNNMDKIPEYVERYKKYILFICFAWHIIVLVSIPFPNSWNGSTFQSFSGTTFRLAPSAMLIMSASLLFIIYFSRKYVWFSFLPFLSIILGTSRTYMAVGFVLMIIILFFAIRNKPTFWFVLLLFGITAIVIILNSAMGEKILHSFEYNPYQDPLSQFTSGRSDFWATNMNAFAKQPWYNKLLGCGYNFVRLQTATKENPAGLWAHNDFIQILLTYGYVGLITYLGFVGVLFKKLFSYKVPTALKIMLFFTWFFNAMFNMVFTYMCATISLYLIVIALRLFYEKKQIRTRA